MDIKFTVYGKPVPKARPRVTRNGVFTPDRTKEKEYEFQFEYMSAGGRMMDGPIHIIIHAYYAIPKRAKKFYRKMMEEGTLKPLVYPDVDNVAKLVCDALNGVAYKDDSQITELFIDKKYHNEPRIDVEVIGITEDNSHD